MVDLGVMVHLVLQAIILVMVHCVGGGAAWTVVVLVATRTMIAIIVHLVRIRCRMVGDAVPLLLLVGSCLCRVEAVLVLKVSADRVWERVGEVVVRIVIVRLRRAPIVLGGVQTVMVVGSRHHPVRRFGSMGREGVGDFLGEQEVGEFVGIVATTRRIIRTTSRNVFAAARNEKWIRFCTDIVRIARRSKRGMVQVMVVRFVFVYCWF